MLKGQTYGRFIWWNVPDFCGFLILIKSVTIWVVTMVTRVYGTIKFHSPVLLLLIIFLMYQHQTSLMCSYFICVHGNILAFNYLWWWCVPSTHDFTIHTCTIILYMLWCSHGHGVGTLFPCISTCSKVQELQRNSHVLLFCDVTIK